MSVPGIGAKVADTILELRVRAPDLQLIFNQLLFKDGF
jgi:hypothetical protein